MWVEWGFADLNICCGGMNAMEIDSIHQDVDEALVGLGKVLNGNILEWSASSR